MSNIAESRPPAKRRRLVNCCEACRIRHLKCDLRTPSCHQCETLGIECVRNVNVRFRHLSQSIAGDFPDQVWMKPTSIVSFQDETTEVASYYEDDAPNGRNTGNQATADVSVQEVRPIDTIDLHPILHSPTSTLERMPPPPPQASPQSFKPSPLMDESPASLDSLSSLGRASPAATYPTILPFTTREAELIRHYSENMALWADTTDLERHFELDIPRRALSNRILRYAIFTFASRHMNRRAGGDWTEAIQYHNQCLELLIPVMSSNEFTDEVFAAVTILRLFEEIDTVKDNRFHLHGATKIFNTLPSLSSSGGLGEAAAWLCLRQDIHISLVHQQPLQSRLENFDKSAAFTNQSPNDPAWTNRIIFYVAKALSVAFLDRTAENLEALRRVGDDVERWKDEKPPTFEPIKFIQRGREADRRLPVIWMLSPFHVLALQYYHIAKILLAISTYGDRMLGYEQFQHGRRVEKHVRNHLLIILGLAASNRRAENTLFEARHTLSVWGGVLRHRLDQEAAKNFLKDVEEKTAFPISSTLKALEEQWEEDSDRS